MTLTFDLHDEAYYAWRAAGIRGALLVHVDAHHDAAADPPWKTVDIGNFVRAAIRDGIVSGVRWVVPDPIWADAKSRAIVIAELENIADAAVVVGGGTAASSVDGAEIVAGPWEAVAPADGAVLLDIDVDYLCTAAYEERRSAEPLAIPWMRPEALVQRVARRMFQPVITTIAASTTGGFAPLAWAHLAREIARRLDGTADGSWLACFDRLHDAALRRAAGDDEGARQACRLAVESCPSEPAAWLHLADSCEALDRLEDARDAFARACALDPTCAHPFRSRGPYLLRRGRFEDAARAYQRALAIAPGDPHAHVGLAMAALGRGLDEDARTLAERALALGAGGVDVWRTLAHARRALGDPRGAIAAYEQALLTALHGATPLAGPWASNPDRRLIDPDHWADHAALGELHAALGNAAAAAVHRRIASAAAPDTLGRSSGGVLPS